MLHNELRRGLHAGLFSLVGCFIQAFHVPVIPPNDLCDFFNDVQVCYLKWTVFDYLKEHCLVFGWNLRM